MRSRKNYADWSYQARTNRVKIVGCPNAENRWPDWTVFLFSAFLCWFVWRYVVSIHAPTRGATFPCLCIRMVLTSFNPRSHEGSNLGRCVADMVILAVSIHAPTRGATRYCHIFGHHIPVSIHAPTRGATRKCLVATNGCSMFQSTLPRGERRFWISSFSSWAAFQSTLPRGERHPKPNTLRHRSQFQSTLPRGERPVSREGVKSLIRVSIHAPTRGATRPV